MNGQETEEKKLVVKWMGLTIEYQVPREFRMLANYPKDPFIEGKGALEHWNPQDNDKATFKERKEICDNMSEKEKQEFYRLLSLKWATTDKPGESLAEFCLGVSPSVFWKALIQMIKEGI